MSRDGKWIASGSRDKTVRVWNLETGECIKTFEDIMIRLFCLLQQRWKEDCVWFLDKTVRVWHVETGECIKTFEGHNGSVCSVCFSSDGKKIASGSLTNGSRVAC